MNRLVRDPNRRPTHPGAVLRLDVLPELRITQEQFARRLGVSRLTVSQVLNEHRALSASMAVLLEHELGTSAEHWLAMQQAVDLWEARRERDTSVSRLFRGIDEAIFTGASTEAANAVERARMTSQRAYTATTGMDLSHGIVQRGSEWTKGERA